MSYHLGIAHFPVLHRQLTSPTSAYFPDSASEDLTQDSKDVLIDRLSDLVLRLTKVRSLQDGAVSAIHREVDKIEVLVNGVEKTNSPSHLLSREKSGHSSNEDDFWGPPTPTQSMKMRVPVVSQDSSPKSVFKPVSEMSPSRAVEVAKAAEELASNLASTVEKLLVRKEESDRIHDLLVTRAERAAERILVLEYRIAEMDDDYQANQSELKFLRIQLQAIQVQCTNCIHRHDDDPELADSIMNWKIDWENINRRAKARRQQKSHVSLTHQMSDASTFVGSMHGT
ncbi:hypothetical protein BKA64DRAFT_424124 [Cadophora sp. MPI-SDFR-AT-0126]|nr:hypothetical protein BKA64DRAFT_424124 [Leotiomycetes sp. MPI-SDFR-AT-0126]